MRYSIYKKQILEEDKMKELFWKFVPDGRKHYIYRVTDLNRENEEYYYGSRTSEKLDIIVDFWSYKTSSKFNILNENKKEDYKIKIIKIFDNAGDKILYESFLHQYFNVKLHNSFWNKSNQTPFGFDTTGLPAWNKGLKTGPIIFTAKHKANLSKAKIGSLHSEETKKKISKSKKGIPRNPDSVRKSAETRRGSKHSAESKKKMSDAQIGRIMTEETKEKLSIANKGKRLSDETKRKISESNKGKKMSKECLAKRGKKIIIFDNNNKKIAETKGNFKEKCKELGIPLAIAETYRNNTYLYDSPKGKTNATNRGLSKFIGWYARLEKENNG